MNLSILILIPLATAVGILIAPNRSSVKLTALLGSIAQAAFAFKLLYLYYQAKSNGNTSQILFEKVYNWFPSLHISLHFGVDGISIAMILLTALVVIGGVLVSWNIEKMTKEFYLLLVLLAMGAYGFFISLDLFILFFFLEISVIPKYLLIGIWGSGKKEYAANKLALMLMGGSALILVGMLGLYFMGPVRTFDLVQLSHTAIPIYTQKLIFPFIFVGFGVFTALFPFHTWVPDGHSSAPTAGSMFLAGISMKLGGYGCLRVATFIMPEGAKEYSTIIIVLSTIAILYGAFATMMQKDLKYINAYSSVSHCGFVLLGIGMLTRVSITGAVMQMVSHGLMTALFFAVIGMIYERTHTRQVDEMGGMLKVTPFISTVLFIVGLCSLGLPGLSGFVAEMTVFMGSWERTGFYHRLATIAAVISIVVTAVYILRAITKVSMGPLNEHTAHITDAKWYEKSAAIILVAAILVIGIAPFWLSDLVKPGAEIIMQKIALVK